MEIIDKSKLDGFECYGMVPEESDETPVVLIEVQEVAFRCGTFTVLATKPVPPILIQEVLEAISEHLGLFRLLRAKADAELRVFSAAELKKMQRAEHIAASLANSYFGKGNWCFDPKIPSGKSPSEEKGTQEI